MTAGMGDAGPCHPRDNIALRYLAENLNLGYDIFDTIMQAREKQADNLAMYLVDLADDYNMPIVIHGKSYKPDINMTDGSYSLLIGHYLEEVGMNFFYVDPNTNDHIANGTDAIVLLAHNKQVTYGYTGELPEQGLYFTPGPNSVIVDPWRTFNSPNWKIIHYGNTRNKI